MTVEELMESLKRRLYNGSINPEDDVVVRNPEVSTAAMEAGSDGYEDIEEILVPKDGRVILLGYVE